MYGSANKTNEAIKCKDLSCNMNDVQCTSQEFVTKCNSPYIVSLTANFVYQGKLTSKKLFIIHVYTCTMSVRILLNMHGITIARRYVAIILAS